MADDPRKWQLPGVAGEWQSTEIHYAAAMPIMGLEVAKANPRRFAIAFSISLTGVQGMVSTSPGATINQGFALVGSGYQQFTVKDWGPLVFFPWYWSTLIGVWDLTVWETIQLP